jgi:uncharacterized protein (DUF1501 family)
MTSRFQTNNASRRSFLQTAAAMTTSVGTAAPLLTQLAALAALSRADAAGQGSKAFSDYRAIVCVFLYGANDHYNTVLPYDQSSYNGYASVRTPTDVDGNGIGLPRASLLPIVPVTSQGSGREFALNPALAGIKQLFDSGKAAVMANVGPLITSTSLAQFTAQNVPLPPKLFSHNDQQSVWQSLSAEGATLGWGGRIGDALAANNSDSLFTCINAFGNAVWMAGRNTVQYQVNTSDTVSTAIAGLSKPTLFGSSSAVQTLQSIVSASDQGLLASDHANIVKRSVEANQKVQSALSTVAPLTTAFEATNSLAAQLKSIARLISARAAFGAQRQVFFVGLGGFDLHDGLIAKHAPLLTLVDSAMKSFYDATVELGVSNNVTTFTASDFGRTLTSNGDGSDHGWGSYHFAVGGAVKGKDIYGSMPITALGTTTDAGGGRLLPTTAVDQYAATLARWMGVSETGIRDVLPNLGNFSNTDLGFMKT